MPDAVIILIEEQVAETPSSLAILLKKLEVERTAGRIISLDTKLAKEHGMVFAVLQSPAVKQRLAKLSGVVSVKDDGEKSALT